MNIYNYKNYQKYLHEHMKSLPLKGHGFKSAIAEEIGCQTTYVSRVLKEKTHFSLEQAEKLTNFLGLTDSESHYFLLLVQKERAGTINLQNYFLKQIDIQRKQHLVLKNRLDVKETLSRENQAIYYSSWLYCAIHALISIPQFQNKVTLSKVLNLPLNKINKVLDFLVSSGVINESKGGYKIGTTRIHLENDSTLISKHHINWRVQAIQSIEREKIDDIHYSSAISLSKDDAHKIKELLIESISKCKSIIKDSKEEVAYGFSLDFFDILNETNFYCK